MALFTVFKVNAQTIDTLFKIPSAKTSSVRLNLMDSVNSTRVGINTATIDFRSKTVTVNYTRFDVNDIQLPAYDDGYFMVSYTSWQALLRYISTGHAFVFTPLGSYLKITYQ